MRVYQLLNKNRLIGSFTVDGINEMEFISSVDIDKDKMPTWVSNFGHFIEKRRAPLHREHIKRLLDTCGCNTLTGFLDVSHALSLNDTFWVRAENQKHLTWDNVSLYKNKFNLVIAKMAFTGGMYGYEFSTTSPEYGTNGTFAKCWVRENGVIKLIKRGSSGAFNAGLEPYSEFYSSQLLEALNIKHVEYGLTSKEGRLASKCDLFTSEKYGLVPFMDIDDNRSLGGVVNFYIKHGLREWISEMFVADAIMFNEDRHLGNFGFLFDNDTYKIIGPAPLYDHNISLLCYAIQEDFIDIDKYIKTNNKGHRLGGGFVSVAKQIMTPSIRKKLINLHGFKFKKHSRYNIPEWRLEALNKAVNNQIEKLLS